jgi:small subunit ribosomal protein S14
MAKKRVIERSQNRRNLISRYLVLRTSCKEEFKQSCNLEERLQIQCKLQKFPSKSVGVRLNNRCHFSGRHSGYYRDFGLSRHSFRRLAQSGFLPGIRKSSW